LIASFLQCLSEKQTPPINEVKQADISSNKEIAIRIIVKNPP